MGLEDRIKVAQGKGKVDLLLRGGKLINLFSGEIYPEDVAIHQGYIVGFGKYPAKEVISVKGGYICPGFIDGHVHLESSMLSVSQFAHAVSTMGTTSIITDAHEIANVMGMEGIKYVLESSKFQPINIFLMLASCIPASSMETAGASLSAVDLYPLLNQKWVLGLGEMMNYPGVLSGRKEILEKLRMSSDKRIDGHAPGLGGRFLSAYASAGIRSDHESTTKEEAKEKLRRGMFVMIREGTSEKNLDSLLPLVNAKTSRYTFFVTDDRSSVDLIQNGSINEMIKRAIHSGIDPLTAVRMGSLNTAEYFRLNQIGAVAPGFEADITIVDNLRRFSIELVFHKGELVAEHGRCVWTKKTPKINLRSSINVKWLEEKDFVIQGKKGNVRVIELVHGQIITKQRIIAPKLNHCMVVSDTIRDILKLVVVERHRASGNIGKGLVKGFGLKKGAIAGSIAHDSHNIICVGVDDRSIFNAAVTIVKIGGGLTVVDGEKVLAKLNLPIGGLMSDQPLGKVHNEFRELLSAAKSLGSKIEDPFMSLSFLALPVLPELRLTDKGVVDVNLFKIVGLFV